MPTQEEQKALQTTIRIAVAIVETIRECGPAPSGHIFAAMMQFGITHDTYQKLIDKLVELEMLECNNYLLTLGKKAKKS